MNLLENIREGLRSIRANMLRTILTALIIAIGITSLVGILTAIDGIQGSLDKSFEGLGANTFDIINPQVWKRRAGTMQATYPAIDYRQALLYKEKFGNNAIISISTNITGIGEIKYASKKTNPNVPVTGIEDVYLGIKGFKLASGRNFSQNDMELATNVAILGDDIVKKLFDKTDPIGKEVSVFGDRFKVIGVLAKKGSFTGGGEDRLFLVPLETAHRMAGTRKLTFDITTSVPNMTNLDFVMEEARSIMRRVRGDAIGQPDSFEMERADSLAKDIDETTGYLRIGGFGIGFITLLGAAIALMNIMMVSVTERTREIGIRKSLGATPYLIRLQFLIEAIVICILGGIGGLVLGIVAGNGVSKIIAEDAVFVVPWTWMIVGLVVCVTVGIISGIYPAYKASKLDPIEALRYE